MEDDLNLRRPQWKMTLREEDLKRRTLLWKSILMEVNLNGSLTQADDISLPSYWEMVFNISFFLVSDQSGNL